MTGFTRHALEGTTGMLTARSRVWGVRLEEAFAFDLDEWGKIKTVTVYIRPLFGLAVLAIALGIRLASRPGVIVRAARGDRHLCRRLAPA